MEFDIVFRYFDHMRMLADCLLDHITYREPPLLDIPRGSRPAHHKQPEITQKLMKRQSKYLTSSKTVSWYLSATAYGTIGSSSSHKQPPILALLGFSNPRQGALTALPSLRACRSIRLCLLSGGGQVGGVQVLGLARLAVLR